MFFFYYYLVGSLGPWNVMEYSLICIFLCLVVWLCLKMGYENVVLMRLLQIGTKVLTVHTNRKTDTSILWIGLRAGPIEKREQTDLSNISTLNIEIKIVKFMRQQGYWICAQQRRCPPVGRLHVQILSLLLGWMRGIGLVAELCTCPLSVPWATFFPVTYK